MLVDILRYTYKIYASSQKIRWRNFGKVVVPRKEMRNTRSILYDIHIKRM
jgi:hypothetical protein